MFTKAVIGGSFDHFHKGHRSFLDYCLTVAKYLVIGVTSDEYLRKNKEGLLENYETRVRSVSTYLNGKNTKFEIVKIEDVYGSTLEPSFDAEAIIATVETQRGAEEINRAREEKGLEKLKVLFDAPIESSEDGYGISSERIRNGEIDKEGKLFINPQWFKITLFTSDDVLPDLKKPFGDLSQKLEREDLRVSGRIFAVGDETVKQIKSLGIAPNVSYIDFKIARKVRFSDFSELGFSDLESIVKLKNPAGTLTPDLFKTASQLSRGGKKQETVVLIDGEDDLSVLPVVLAAPLGSVVFYGQPNEGIVKVIVDEKHKVKAAEIVARFTTRGH